MFFVFRSLLQTFGYLFIRMCYFNVVWGKSIPLNAVTGIWPSQLIHRDHQYETDGAEGKHWKWTLSDFVAVIDCPRVQKQTLCSYPSILNESGQETISSYEQNLTDSATGDAEIIP